MQMDPLTRNWIPPHYVQRIEVGYGDRTVMLVEGDISLSENPSIHFSFVPDRPGELSVRVLDSEDKEFSTSVPLGRPAES
jgi:sulfur-oxidizing protein SoxY